jgi:hypothetical protein
MIRPSVRDQVRNQIQNLSFGQRIHRSRRHVGNTRWNALFNVPFLDAYEKIWPSHRSQHETLIILLLNTPHVDATINCCDFYAGVLVVRSRTPK